MRDLGVTRASGGNEPIHDDGRVSYTFATVRLLAVVFIVVGLVIQNKGKNGVAVCA